MNYIASEKAVCVCEHRGKVSMRASQDWVRVEGAPLLVKGDFDHRAIANCMGGAEIVGVTRCVTVATVDDEKSHSHFVTIDGRGVGLSTAAGATDWSQTLTASWSMSDPGQSLIAIKEG